MALIDKKITAYANPVTNLPDHPSQEGWTAAALKAAFDANATGEIKTAINGIIDALLSVADSNSGADNIGATAITNLDGTTVQALLESLRNKLKSLVDGSSGADFVGATAINELSGTTVQALLESLKSFVDTYNTNHKTAIDQIENEIRQFVGANANAEVADARISTAKNKTFTDLRERLEELEYENAMPHVFLNLQTGKKYKYGYGVSADGIPQIISEEVI